MYFCFFHLHFILKSRFPFLRQLHEMNDTPQGLSDRSEEKEPLQLLLVGLQYKNYKWHIHEATTTTQLTM